eukprot:CAMPEP_0195300264 /NCGR_PEP_ID=MMETSP0707-20130614/27069_1 /TAXON_ID=33640 /ORGANISM="Asterionellopsis glacialis, Strain CCMP134" /LENGTH=394 /DNA_ID=CAMNT_0040362909 /DNA_START=150 /DNA_END=1330 /DNA_ORIENTATION=-
MKLSSQALLLVQVTAAFAFVPSLSGNAPFARLHVTKETKTWASLDTSDDQIMDTNYQENLVGEEGEESFPVVRAPLRFIGPYPTMGLRFPELATASQRERNVTGISLDFVLDTGANTNTINAQVAKELNLEIVGEALPGLGAGGEIDGGNTYFLGDCQLDGIPKQEKDVDDFKIDEPFTFMTELTASALPVASPAAAGLLSLPFLNCFPGGVQFDWGGSSGNPPSITFYGDETHLELDGMTRVPIESLPVTMLPSVTLHINGIEIPALFDTGSPITVLNAQAAQAADIETVEGPTINDDAQKSKNPFAKMAANFQAAQATAQAAARGDILAIAGANGQPVQLLKTTSKVSVGVSKQVDIGESHVYVGDLPGLAALDGLGGDSPPAAVLGMDVLR